jgi:mycoredoxin
MSTNDAPVTLYTSRFCGHSLAVERFMKKHDIPVNQINIDGDDAARERVKAINNGYASVPTLIFADGSILTEPSFGQLRVKLGVDKPSLAQKLGRIGGKKE